MRVRCHQVHLGGENQLVVSFSPAPKDPATGEPQASIQVTVKGESPYQVGAFYEFDFVPSK